MTTVRYAFGIALAALVFAGAVGPAAAQRADRTPQARQLVMLLVKRDYAGVAKRFDDKMRQALPADKLKMVWENLTAQVGAFQKQGAARTEKAEEGGKTYDVVVITCQFARRALDAKFVFNQQGQVSGLFFMPNQQ